MGRVDTPLHSLQIVTIREYFAQATLRFGCLGPLEFRKGWHLVQRPHIGPYDVRHFPSGLGPMFDAFFEATAGWLCGRLQYVPLHVHLPAMVDAA